MSAFEGKTPTERSRAYTVGNQLRILLRRTVGTIRQSRLGMAGTAIVLAFAFIAVFAPWISPYPKTFEAPEADRFVVSMYNVTLPTTPGNASYHTPVMGPTTPLSADRAGGMWQINYADSGYVQMDFLHSSLGLNVSPYKAGNLSIWFDVNSNITLPAPPVPPPVPLSPPLTAIYYIVPGKNQTLQFGSGMRNGAVAFFSGRDFVAADPFTLSAFVRQRLDFDPVYTGEDPSSSGNLLVQPLQRSASVGIGTFPVGPYRYFWASDLNHTAVFELTYVHEGDPLRPSGHLVTEINESLSAPPFVYYNQEKVDKYETYRAGIGQAILLPLTNNTLEVRNVTGAARAWVPLNLSGEPAVVSGNIGFTRSTFPMWFYLPLRSANHAGLAYFDLASLTLLPNSVFVMPDAGWEPIGLPLSTRAETIYAGFYRAANDTSFLVGLNATASPVPQFQAYIPGKIRTYFEVDTRTRVFIYTADHKIMSMATTFKTDALEVPQLFAVIPPTTVPQVVYAGAFGGTLFGSAVTPQEVNGAYTDPATRRTVVFQLLGTTRAPLAPGVYPSGNRYLLGTDFIGHDILTLVFWGTQVAFLVGILAALFAVGLGTITGLVAGYYGKIVDTLLMRTTDIFLVLPFLPIVLILDAILRPSVWTIILVLSLLTWPGIARVIRAQVLSLKERNFVDAARVSGASDLRLIFLHIAPNVLPFSFLYMSLFVAGAIITEAALSFLGLGDATVISWGGILSSVLTQGGALVYWWWLIPPGLAITILSLGFYLLGRGFDEIINPRLRRR